MTNLAIHEMTPDSKPSFPEPSPTIEVFPGVHATLLADFDRYCNGSIPFGGSWMEAKSNGKQIGEIGADGAGRWIFKVERATYLVDMNEAFEAVQNAHFASL